MTVAVTFVAPGLPPLTVWIPEEEDSDEVRAERIRARIEEETGEGRQIIRV